MHDADGCCLLDYRCAGRRARKGFCRGVEDLLLRIEGRRDLVVEMQPVLNGSTGRYDLLAVIEEG